MISLGVHSESTFPEMKYIFSRKLCFLWSHCLLVITESINLDTSVKTTVGFFLKITCPSWTILLISLDKLSSLDWLLKSWWWIFLKWFLFYCCKRILIWQKNFWGFLENLFEYYFWNIIVNVNFFSDLKFA